MKKIRKRKSDHLKSPTSSQENRKRREGKKVKQTRIKNGEKGRDPKRYQVTMRSPLYLHLPRGIRQGPNKSHTSAPNAPRPSD
jgi:hypothetical protein